MSDYNCGIQYPRVLICCANRINASDSSSMGLLLRSLFGEWPRERLAQIYTGGSNDDDGFCNAQYMLCRQDRRFGDIFYHCKAVNSDVFGLVNVSSGVTKRGPLNTVTKAFKEYLLREYVHSSLYEYLFSWKPSDALKKWFEAYKPDMVFALGYSVTMMRIPMYIKHKYNVPYITYSPDDWPSYIGCTSDASINPIRLVIKGMIEKEVMHYFNEARLCIAFNSMMAEVYQRRYGVNCEVLMHGDEHDRYNRSVSMSDKKQAVILTSGSFYSERVNALNDLANACELLNRTGTPVKLKVLTDRAHYSILRLVENWSCVSVCNDPGHNSMPAYLQSADVLVILESHEEKKAKEYSMSISSKAHLYMYSGVPIIVYAHESYGTSVYARNEGWAILVTERSVDALADAIKMVIYNKRLRRDITENAVATAKRNHDIYVNRKRLRNIMFQAVK